MTWVPDACTLPTVEQPTRLAEFDALFATAVRPPERLDATGLRLRLPGGDETAATARDLIGRETRCCSFFSFDLRSSPEGTVLDVRVPPSRAAVLDALQRRAGSAGPRGG